MTQQEITQLQLELADQHSTTTLKTTHVSWVILCSDVVYKIPKAVSLPYLDFSTLAQRRLYCENEVRLNRRLTDGVYLGVETIWKKAEQYGIGAIPAGATIVDYAIKMKRLPQDRLMYLMLQKGKVEAHHILALAQQMASFHQKAALVATAPSIATLQTDFADLRSSKAVVAQVLHQAAAKEIEEWVLASNHFLQAHEGRMLERHQLGYYRELHGDLHSENIFLLEEPVVFDCIAFNEHFRQGDVLNELAFFCMDMDYHRQAPLGHQFLQHYLSNFPGMETEEDQQLFLYYKLYRANVRLKVNALKWEQSTEPAEQKKRAEVVREYFYLMRYYAKAVFNPLTLAST